VRDDFSKSTIEKIAKRAGYLCSNPECRLPTIGAAQGHGGVMNVGEAAHITAASPGGPRYDATLTTEERRAEANGIWLCRTHAKLVDSDDQHFTVDVLRGWKRDSEERSFRALMEAGTDITAQEQRATALDEVLVRLSEAAKRDLAAFKRMAWWPRYAVALGLRMPDEAGSPSRYASFRQPLQWRALAENLYASRLETWLLRSAISPCTHWVAGCGEQSRKVFAPVLLL
jgi:hypothetical protein